MYVHYCPQWETVLGCQFQLPDEIGTNTSVNHEMMALPQPETNSNTISPETNDFTITEHRRLGHFGSESRNCITCIQSKRRKRNTPHLGKLTDHPLEVSWVMGQ